MASDITPMMRDLKAAAADAIEIAERNERTDKTVESAQLVVAARQFMAAIELYIMKKRSPRG